MTDWLPRPSVFTPFIRRFTDEHAREIAETRTLYNEVRAAHLASPFASDESRITIGSGIYQMIDDVVPEGLMRPFIFAIDDILKAENVIFGFQEIDFDVARLSMKEGVDLRRFLRAKQYFFANQDRIIPALENGIARVLGGIADGLPQSEDPGFFTIPMILAHPEPKWVIDRVYGTLADKQYREFGLFADIVDRLYRNLCEVSDIEPYAPNNKKKFKNAHDTNMPLEEAVRLYADGTMFHPLLMFPVPLRLSYEQRFSHMHVLGGSGAGKTTLLEHLILHDLESDNPPSLVVVDSQGDLIRKVSRLDGIADRLVLIDPKDIHHPPALNIFDVNRPRSADYDEATREQVTAGVIQTFDYLFAGLLGADLTAKQGVFFKFVARLMLSLPESLGRNATILDMMQLMEDAKPYKKAIEALPPIPRSFFEKDFNLPVFRQTKEQIRYRLQAIIENPTMARLFTAPETKVDLFNEMNRGSVILVDTAKDFLKGASANYGRIFISLVLQAVLERAAVPEEDRKPVFLIVDEAASYFDSNIDDLLTEARKYKCGIVLAHQYLDQTSYSLRASLAANTSIKFAAGVSNSDARVMAADMRTTPEFILDQPRLHFAAHIRNVTPQAVSIPVVPGRLAERPQLSSHSFEELKRRNRERVALPKQEIPIDLPSAVQVPDEDVSDQW